MKFLLFLAVLLASIVLGGRWLVQRAKGLGAQLHADEVGAYGVRRPPTGRKVGGVGGYGALVR